VWCCVLTFYRVAAFSYRATAAGAVVAPPGGGDGDEARALPGGLAAESVSADFLAAHGRERRHQVFQMPLASVARVEAVPSSAQSAALAGPGGGGGDYPYNALLASPSTVSSAMSQTAGAAMSQFMSGIAAKGSSSGNLLANGPSFGNAGGTASLTNNLAGVSSHNTPLGIIIHGKDGGRTIRFSAASHVDVQKAQEALNTYAFPGRRNLGYLFAFESRRAEVQSASAAGSPPAVRRRFIPQEEFARQGIASTADAGLPASPWALETHANAAYGLCATYPAVLVGPRSLVASTGAEVLLRRVAAFRAAGRLPALTWAAAAGGGSIWRASQPKVGLQGNRSAEDERYLGAIAEGALRANLEADSRDEGGVGKGARRAPPEFLRMLCGGNNEIDLILEGAQRAGCVLKIMDMRPKIAAAGNRTQGYGYENTNHYRGMTINFYGIGNVHAVRDAYQKMCALCLSPNTNDVQWMQLIENTNWPSMIRLILSAAWQTAFHVHYNRLPVLVHCSHGWDRTSQVPALAQLLLDPHYRTREGFSTLVEKDFLSFGHPLHTRCGHGEGKNEQGGDEGQLSPIFLQFLDCVFQLVNQFPDYFEFNTRYLLLLSEHIYSCRFGTLLCDSEREREVVAGIRQRTYCLWDFLDSVPELRNPSYIGTGGGGRGGVLLMPLPVLMRNIALWTDRYCMYGAKATVPCAPPGAECAGLPTYAVQSPMEPPLVLHTARDGADATLRRALEDAEMWKETAMSALREVKELKEKDQLSSLQESKRDDGDTS